MCKEYTLLPYIFLRSGACILRTFFSTNSSEARKNPRSNGCYESYNDTFNRNPNDVQIDQDAICYLIERR